MKPEDIKKKYGYMDKLPAHGWVWEFARRNPEYRNAFEDLSLALEEGTLSVPESFFTTSDITLKVTSDSKLVVKKMDFLEDTFGIKPTPIKNGDDAQGYLVAPLTNATDFKVGFPDPNSRYCDFKTPPAVKGAKPVVSTKFSQKAVDELMTGDMTKFHKYCFKAINKISPAKDIQDTLYIGISMNASKDSIRRYIDDVLDEHIKPVKVKFRPEKWKLYMMVYDLSTQTDPKMTYRAIADLLYAAFPKDRVLEDDLHMQKYKKNALSLIHSDYLKYMYM